MKNFISSKTGTFKNCLTLEGVGGLKTDIIWMAPLRCIKLGNCMSMLMSKNMLLFLVKSKVKIFNSRSFLIYFEYPGTRVLEKNEIEYSSIWTSSSMESLVAPPLGPHDPKFGVKFTLVL